MQVELMQDITKNRGLITDLRNEYEKNRQRVEAKIEDLADKGRGRTESIVKLQHDIEETNERIIKSRRAAANNASARDKLAVQEDPTATGPSIDKEFVDEIDEEIKEMRTEINGLTEAVARLDKQSMSHRAADGQQSAAAFDALVMKNMEERCVKAIEQQAL